jgi:serine/threonine protein kinase
MSFARQLSFLKPVSLALQHAHNHKDARGKPSPVYHRNICPETVFQMRDGTVKLGDFDFAKFGDETISVPGQTLIAKPYTAPELLKNSSQASARSDIYALGVLWYFMASLPATPKQFNPAEIDALELPEHARTLLKRMTANNPLERPAKIEEVLEVLSEYREI